MFERRTKSERRAVHHSPLNSNERKELLVGEVPTGEQLFYLSFDEFREWGVVGARSPTLP